MTKTIKVELDHPTPSLPKTFSVKLRSLTEFQEYLKPAVILSAVEETDIPMS